jgi:glycosyltransferase involved in cell wall biosynthesis
MNQPLISCIVPVFNGERYLAEALNSIIAQPHRPLEIIVADDGSSDETASVARGYGAQVRYLRQPNQGPAAARNLGLSRAQGDFIAFLDADDLWHPEKLGRQMARFRARPELEYCITHVQNFRTPKDGATANGLENYYLGRPLPGYVTVTLLARRSLFGRVGPFNPALHHGDDTDWYLRAKERGAEMELLPDVLVHRRIHDANMSQVQAAQSREEYLHILKGALDRRRSR